MNLKKIINLSPLVDVLMIVIFWYIMMSNQTIEANKENAKAELETAKKEYENASDELMEQLEHEIKEKEKLISKVSELEEQNNMLNELLNESVEYMYIRLLYGMDENRIVEVHYKSELINKIVFSDTEEEYLTNKLNDIIPRYAREGRMAIIFIYEGNKSLYVDTKKIMDILNNIHLDFGVTVHTINIAG